MNEIDKLALLYIQDEKLLVARSIGKDIFYIPGGKKDPGETDQQALIREIKEELSVDLIPDTIRHAVTLSAQAHGKPEGVMVKTTCYYADFSGQPIASSEIEELAWIDYRGKEQCSLVTQMIIDWLASRKMMGLHNE